MTEERYIQIREERSTHIVCSFIDNEIIEEIIGEDTKEYHLITTVYHGIYDYNSESFLSKEEVEAYVKEMQTRAYNALNLYYAEGKVEREWMIDSEGSAKMAKRALESFVDYNPNLTTEDIPSYAENADNLF